MFEQPLEVGRQLVMEKNLTIFIHDASIHDIGVKVDTTVILLFDRDELHKGLLFRMNV